LITEIIGTIFGFLAVILTIKQNIWCWFFGLIQVIIYSYVFFEAKLYSDMLLHIIYIFLQIWGWYSWKYYKNNLEKLKVSQVKSMLLWGVVVLVFTCVLGLLMQLKTDASLPYLDAFTTIASLVAQYLLIKKKLGSWIFWIIVDVVAIFIYCYKELYFTSGLYAVFLVLAILGYIEWKKNLKAELTIA